MTLCSVLCLAKFYKFWHSFTCWKDETNFRLKTSKFRENLTKSEFKINHVAKLPNQNRYKSQQQIAHEQRREKDYLFQWLHSWTHTIYTFESKNEMQVIQEGTCYESLTKKCVCNNESQIAKFLHEAACFRFESYAGPKLLNGS